MKFSTSAAIALAASGAYAQISVLLPLMSDVGDKIDALNSAAKAYSGGDISAVTAKADALISSIKSGNSKAASSSDLSLTDALGLKDPVDSLTTKGTALEATFKSRISDIEKASACSTVREKLTDINSASQSFIKTVTGKTPKAAQDIAAALSAQLTKVLNQAQADFSEQNCKDSGSKPTGGSGSSSAAPTGGASSAAPTESAAPTGSAPAETTAAPSQTGGSGECHSCQGGNGTAPTTSSVPVAGAGALAPAGALVLAVAAALL